MAFQFSLNRTANTSVFNTDKVASENFHLNTLSMFAFFAFLPSCVASSRARMWQTCLCAWALLRRAFSRPYGSLTSGVDGDTVDTTACCGFFFPKASRRVLPCGALGPTCVESLAQSQIHRAKCMEPSA